MPYQMLRRTAMFQVGLVVAIASLFAVPSQAQSTAGEKSTHQVFMPKSASLVGPKNEAVVYHVLELPFMIKKNDGEAVHVGTCIFQRSELLPVESAKEYYTKLIQANPDNVWALTMRALVLFKVDREAHTAIKDLDNAIRRNPMYAPAYDLRGNVLCSQARFELAVQDHEQALRIDPKCAYSWLGRGIVCLESRVFYQAIDDFSEAIRLNPKMVLAYVRRADALAATTAYRSAIADYTSAISLDPSNAEAFDNRGDAFRMIDDSRAIDDHKKARQLDPDGPAPRGKVFLIK